MSFEIEKDVPMPRGRPRLYPFPDMQHGDSFFVPFEGREPKRIQNAVRGAAGHYRKRHNVPGAFVTRTQEGGVRCWYLADAESR